MARRNADPTEPASVWAERDVIGGKTVNALVVILRSRGCYWSKKSGCLMCGYNNDSLESVGAQDLIAQFSKAMDMHKDQPFIKIYTSGSFLDPGEIEPKARDSILGLAGQKASHVLVESRPEFVSQTTLDAALAHVKNLEVAIGLETANDDVRSRCINKGFAFKDFERACKTVADAGASVRTYLLLKPPYMTEGDAIADTLASIERAGKMSQTISVNPMNVQRGTLVEGLWKKKMYRPPWLWSLISVLERGSKLTDARLMSSPSGGGSKRGVHNCGKCDEALLKCIERFSLSGDTGDLKSGGCKCKEAWLDQLDAEPFIGTAGDLQRLA